LLRNVGIGLPIGSALYPRKRKPQMQACLKKLYEVIKVFYLPTDAQ